MMHPSSKQLAQKHNACTVPAMHDIPLLEQPQHATNAKMLSMILHITHTCSKQQQQYAYLTLQHVSNNYFAKYGSINGALT